MNLARTVYKGIIVSGICLSGVLLSCQSNSLLLSNKQQADSVKTSASFVCTLTAEDLTEDGFRVSSGNDEMLTLIYLTTDSCSQAIPILKSLTVFDKNNNTIQLSSSTFFTNTSALLDILLIEMDSERSVDEIVPEISIQLKNILNAYQSGNLTEINRYLMDEDLIVIKRIPWLDLQKAKQKSFLVKGVHRLDSYTYRLTITKDLPAK